MFSSSIQHQSITIESIAPNTTPPVSRSHRALDYLAYLTMNENTQTLLYSTFLILLSYLLAHIPYWFYELTNQQLFSRLKDMFFVCHVCKPAWYMLTNEKYRDHVWAILQCKTFRVLPNLLRRKSRVITSRNNNSNNSNLSASA